MYPELDRYYTPESVAKNILRDVLDTSPKVCLDTSCGSGQLLNAANEAFNKTLCVGIDRDKRTIAKLKRSKPNWMLSTADILTPKSYKKTSVISNAKNCDLLLLNPPFSMKNRKFVETIYGGEIIRSSIAFAHVLQSFELFKPEKGAIIILPESALYSEIDQHARSLISRDYEIKKVTDLSDSTFSGATVHASVISVKPKSFLFPVNPTHNKQNLTPIHTSLIRGGLPVHKMIKNTTGTLYLHTTSLKALINSVQKSGLERTSTRMLGRVSGWVILFPRVGLPDREAFKAIFLEEEIQLSDCVFALEFNSSNEAKKAQNRVLRFWLSFREIYKGTWARDTTISKLQEWLESRDIFTTEARS